jgi:hypothetical protein
VDDQSNQKLKSAIATRELSPRKHAIAKEILRRRYTVPRTRRRVSPW